jgi:hypothetical protein
MTPETTPVDKALWERIVALLRYQAIYPGSFPESAAIVAQLPIPVDPLVLRAREIVADVCLFSNQQDYFRSGNGDEDLTMRAVLAALREKEAG